MTVQSTGNYSTILKNLQKTIDINVIDIKDIKSILYLGIKGNIALPAEEQHTVDTFA